MMGSAAAGEHAAVEVALLAVVEKVRSDDEACRIEGAREIRRLTKTSAKNRRHLAGAIEPLVRMLISGGEAAGGAALLALLNIAVKDESNKVKIVDAGALGPMIGYLQSTNTTLQEYATAALLTLTASSANKPIISSSGTIPLLVEILKDGSYQSKVDAVMALYNLSTAPNAVKTILFSRPVPALIDLLKSCKKSSKIVEKCTAILGSLVEFEEGRNAVTDEDGGMLTLVEVLEDGSVVSREHAVGALLVMCESDRHLYRELILKEGAIPGLLELTVQGTPSSQKKARLLLQLLRSSPYPRTLIEPETLESVVTNIVSQIDGGDERLEKARKILAEMVQVSMEQSLRHLQQRASLCTPANEPPLGKVSLK